VVKIAGHLDKEILNAKIDLKGMSQSHKTDGSPSMPEVSLGTDFWSLKDFVFDHLVRKPVEGAAPGECVAGVETKIDTSCSFVCDGITGISQILCHDPSDNGINKGDAFGNES